MGDLARTTAGHLCIDLTHVPMTGNQQRELLGAVQTTVVAHLARMAAGAGLVTISLLPDNNGTRPAPEPSPPSPTPPPRPRS